MEESLVSPMASQGNKETQATDKNAMISKFPRDCSWLSVPLYHYQGFWYVELYLKGILEAQELNPSHFNLSPFDVIVCSSMKSGTTWLKALAFSIATRSRFNLHFKEHPLFSSIPHDLIPFIEIDIAQNQTPRDPELPLLSTHMSYSALPKSILTSGCKIVYICRNPKDVFLSLWHFARNTGISKEHIALEEAFELFCRGISISGPYWDHVLEYWKASLEHPERILFLKYEDMMKNAVSYVKRLAEFMGCPFSKEEEMEGVPMRIVEMCSFGSLSELEVNKMGKHRTTGAGSEFDVSNSTFFRKAKVDDWKNHLTEEMANKLDQIILEKLGNSGLTL